MAAASANGLLRWQQGRSVGPLSLSLFLLPPTCSIIKKRHGYIYTHSSRGRAARRKWPLVISPHTPCSRVRASPKKAKKCRAHIVAIFPLNGNFIGAKEKSRGKQNCPFAFRASGGVSRASSAGRSVRAHAERQEGGEQERRNFFLFLFFALQTRNILQERKEGVGVGGKALKEDRTVATAKRRLMKSEEPRDSTSKKLFWQRLCYSAVCHLALKRPTFLSPSPFGEFRIRFPLLKEAHA